MINNWKNKDWLLLGVVAVVNFAARIAVVRPGSFQFADGIRLMDLDVALESKAQPLLPVLSHLVGQVAGDAILSSALVASLFGTLMVFPLFYFARKIYSASAAWWAVALYSTSFTLYIHSAGVTANSLLSFCLLLFLFYAAGFTEKPDDPRPVAFVLFWSGCSALARPEGMILWPPALLILFIHFWKSRKLSWKVLPALVPFAAWAAWNFRKSSFEYGSEMTLGASLVTLKKFASYFTEYFLELSASLLHVYFLLALLGILFFVLRKDKGRVSFHWHLFLFYFATGMLVTLSAHWAFVPRLLAPLTLLLVLPAADFLARVSNRHYIIRTACISMVALTALGGTVIVAGLYRNLENMGDDIYQAAKSLPTLELKGMRILSDLPVETSYYSGLEVLPYFRELVAVGDVVVLHNIQTDLAGEQRFLGNQFVVEKLLQKSSPYVSPKKGGLPVVTGKVRMMDLSERKNVLVETPYKTVVLRLSAMP